MILTKKIVKKAMQKASAMQKKMVDTADLIISHGKEFHPLTKKCDWCDKVRKDFLDAQKKGEL